MHILENINLPFYSFPVVITNFHGLVWRHSPWVTGVSSPWILSYNFILCLQIKQSSNNSFEILSEDSQGSISNALWRDASQTNMAIVHFKTTSLTTVPYMYSLKLFEFKCTFSSIHLRPFWLDSKCQTASVCETLEVS